MKYEYYAEKVAKSFCMNRIVLKCWIEGGSENVQGQFPYMLGEIS